MKLTWYNKTWNDLGKDELYQIAKKRIEIFVIEQNCPYQELDDLDQKAFHIYAMNLKMEVQAYARIIPAGVLYSEAAIGRVLVSKKTRGRSLGKELMNRTIVFCHDDLKQNAIRISAQEYLLTFYKNLGFISTGKTYLEDGIPHVEMLKEK